MRLKTYTAGSLPEAMAQVRRNLGADAIILSTKPDGDGGVQVTAALDADGGHAEPAAATPGTETIAEALDYHRVPTGLVERLVDTAGAQDAATETEALAAALAGEIAFARPPRIPGKPAVRRRSPSSPRRWTYRCSRPATPAACARPSTAVPGAHWC